MSRVLVLNPYAAGSHSDFVRGWRSCSRHELVELALPGRHWKWRMRHAAWTLAQRARELGGGFDAVWATDMLDLAAWRGLAPGAIARLPHTLYMHESQLAYPDPRRGERDLHFAFTNLFSAAAADHVCWNSAFHRDLFAETMRALLARMPDHAPDDALDGVLAKSSVVHPGHDVRVERAARGSVPRIVWVSRWERDKNPEDFFAAACALADEGVAFRLDVLGQPGGHQPPLFTDMRARLEDRIDAWGYLASRADYLAALAAADLVVSTAHHEFFGVAVVEAVAAGAFPLLPRRLAYPEVFASLDADIFYDGSRADLIRRLRQLLARASAAALWPASPTAGITAVEPYRWRPGHPADDLGTEST